MLRADVVQAHILPRSVADVVAEATAAGCSKGSPATTYGWALHRQTLLLWKIEDALQASVRRLQLPDAPYGRCFVEVIPHNSSTAVTVLMCTGSGQLYVWLDANFPAAPFSRQLFVNANSSTNEDAVICALAASPADSGSSLGFVAVVATADAALHLYHGSQNGIFPRQFYTPSTAAGPKAGMFGTLGSVVKALYSEAFDPLHNVQRSSASAMAALQLQLLPLDGNRWKLLVLTPEALDCWLLGSLAGQHSSEQLLWSYNLYGVLSGSLQARELTALAFATSSAPHSQPAAAAVPATPSRTPGRQAVQPRKQVVYVWSTHVAVNSIMQVHALTTLALEEGSVVPTYLQSMQLAPDLPLPQPQPAERSNWQMLPHSSYSSCLLLAPNGTLLEWLPSAGAPHALGSSTENLAITCSRPTNGSSRADNWQLLNASYGVLEFVAQDPEAVGKEATAATGSMTAEQEATATELISKTVELMAKEYTAGCPYKDLAEGLSDRLARLGVFAAGQRGYELLMAASRDLVDTMAKPGSSGVSSGSLKALLSDKQTRHDLLLSAYQSSGVLQQLPPQHARAVFEHSEMLAAVATVLQWQRQQEAAAAAGDAQTGVTAIQTAAAASAIESAGILAAEGVETAGSSSSSTGLNQQWEVFFSRPSASIPALFRTVGTQAAAVKQELARDDRSGSALHALQQLLGLCGVLQAAVTGAQAKTAELAPQMSEEMSHAAAAGPSWLSGEKARTAWGQIAEACLQLHSSLLEAAHRLQLARGGHLPALQQVLAGLRETIMCSSNPSPRLREEYARLPAEHGAVLLRDAEEELDALRSFGVLAAAYEANAEGSSISQSATDSIAAVQRALVWPLEALAQQHRCHVLLYDACELLLTTGLLDSGRLQQHMQQEVTDARGMLPADSFTFYVMERWRSTGQLSSLLQLGRCGFQHQLQQFLAGYPALLWMSEVQANMVAKAAGSLAAAADAEQESVTKCRRLLCLSKLAAHAAGVDARQSQLQLKASARLRQLALQQQLGVQDQAPLSTAQLAQAALAAAEAGQGEEAAAAAVAAVEALALIPEKQQNEQYWHLWDASWLAVLRNTPLQGLAAARAASRTAGGQPDQYEAQMKASPLYVAIQRAAVALADASQAQSGTSAAAVLDQTGGKLAEEVQQQQPGAADCLQDLLSSAAAAAQPVLIGA